jgi:hypothetical protein
MTANFAATFQHADLLLLFGFEVISQGLALIVVEITCDL